MFSIMGTHTLKIIFSMPRVTEPSATHSLIITTVSQRSSCILCQPHLRKMSSLIGMQTLKVIFSMPRVREYHNHVKLLLLAAANAEEKDLQISTPRPRN
nr:hypothetical protein [Tanacetum cinerariifolium]